MSNFSLLLTLGIILLLLSIISVNENLPECDNDSLTCPDGTIIFRDVLNNCSFPKCNGTELEPYCTKNIISVSQKNNLIKTTTSLLGGGFTIYSESNVTNCPIIAPSLQSGICKETMNYDWDLTINCSLANKSKAYKCPEDAYELKGYKWINCTLMPQYCEPRMKQWIAFNCQIDFVK